MMIFRLLIFILFIFKSFSALSETGTTNSLHSSGSYIQQAPLECNDLKNKKTLIHAWYVNEPYQYQIATQSGRTTVIGMDIELVNAFAKKVGINIIFEQDSWLQDQVNIKNGVADMASGATYTPERNEYAIFSKPYRSEEISLFVIKPLSKKLNFQNIQELMAQIRMFSLRLGIVKGAVYGLPEFTNFLYSEKNQDLIISYQNDMELVNSLMKKEIDGFISDRIVGAVNILGQRGEKGEKIIEVPLNIKTPIHLMFSRKTVSSDIVEQFNFAIDEFINNSKYKKIINTYIYHILLPKSIDSRWCHFIGLLGSLAFAISGIILAARRNNTLFGTFLLAILPSISSCIILDLIVSHDTGHLNLYFTPSYFYYVFIAVLISFIAVKLFSYYNKQNDGDNYLEQLLNNIIAICDALGQATFIIIGVVIVIIKKIEPLGFWGPFFAFITSNSGMILRDFIIKNRLIKRVPTGIAIEISILWSIFFSILLDICATNPYYNTIKYSMTAIIAGAFITNLLVYHFGFPEWRFRGDKITDENDSKDQVEIIDKDPTDKQNITEQK